MVFVLTTLLSVSCGSDDGGESTGDPSEPIVGNWKYIGYIFEGQYGDGENEACEDLFYKFNSNGSGKVTQEECDEPSYITDFTWEKTSSTTYYLTAETGEEADSKITFSESNTKMNLYEEGSNNAAVFQRQ